MTNLAIVLIKKSEGVSVEMAWRFPDGTVDRLETVMPVGTSMTAAIYKALVLIKKAEDLETKALLAQPPKGTT